MRSTKLIFPVVFALLLPLAAQEKVDLAAVNKIKAEALNDSKVMDTMFYLTDVYGPRLTNSPNYKAAGDWAVKRLGEYGLVNVHEEKWGPFGRGWANKYFEAHMVEPRFASLVGVPLAWTEGTKGSITGEPVLAVIKTEEDMAKYKGKLSGKIVMVTNPRELPLPTIADAKRYNDADLTEQAEAPELGKTWRLAVYAANARRAPEATGEDQAVYAHGRRPAGAFRHHPRRWRHDFRRVGRQLTTRKHAGRAVYRAHAGAI